MSAPGARHPARVFSLNQPGALGMAEDGTLHVVLTFGVVSFDPVAKEAELLFLDGGRDEVVPSISDRFSGSTSILSVTKTLLVTGSDSGLIRVAVDALSSETEPTRTIAKLPSGGHTLTEIQALYSKRMAAGWTSRPACVEARAWCCAFHSPLS